MSEPILDFKACIVIDSENLQIAGGTSSLQGMAAWTDKQKI
jgi:hypothetical protein